MYVCKCANISKRAFGMAVIKLSYHQQTLVVSLISGLWSLLRDGTISRQIHTHIV